jgi:hypothetical protein
MGLDAHPLAEPFDFVTQTDADSLDLDLFELPGPDDATVASALAEMDGVRRVVWRSVQADVLAKVDGNVIDVVNELNDAGWDYELSDSDDEIEVRIRT